MRRTGAGGAGSMTGDDAADSGRPVTLVRDDVPEGFVSADMAADETTGAVRSPQQSKAVQHVRAAQRNIIREVEENAMGGLLAGFRST